MTLLGKMVLLVCFHNCLFHSCIRHMEASAMVDLVGLCVCAELPCFNDLAW